MPGPFRRRIGVRETPVAAEKLVQGQKLTAGAKSASGFRNTYAALNRHSPITHDFATFSATC